MGRRFAAILSVAALAANPISAAAECGMGSPVRHIDPDRTRIYASPAGIPSIYFHADVDVNTDGSSRSYHPADPRGRNVALNNIGNAISGIWDARGRPIDCAPRRGACFTRYIDTFVAARDSGWNPVGHPRVATDGMIPWKLDSTIGRRVPCTIRTGPYRGFFVSQTSFFVDPSQPECEQSRYIDSLAFQAAVLPKRTNWTSQSQRANAGDLVVVHSPTTGRTAYGIIGDAGPADGIGEASVAMAAYLRNRPVSPNATYQEIKALALDSAQYVIFPGESVRSHIQGPLTQEAINRVVEPVFTRWGGPARLAQCSALPH